MKKGIQLCALLLIVIIIAGCANANTDDFNRTGRLKNDRITSSEEDTSTADDPNTDTLSETISNEERAEIEEAKENLSDALNSLSDLNSEMQTLQGEDL